MATGSVTKRKAAIPLNPPPILCVHGCTHKHTHTQTHTYRAQRIYQCTNTPGIHTNTNTQVLHSRGGPLTTAHFRSLKKCLNPAGPQGLRYTRNKQPCKKAFGNMTKCFFNITNQWNKCIRLIRNNILIKETLITNASLWINCVLMAVKFYTTII
jgi:hypothetical protein